MHAGTNPNPDQELEGTGWQRGVEDTVQPFDIRLSLRSGRVGVWANGCASVWVYRRVDWACRYSGVQLSACTSV